MNKRVIHITKVMLITYIISGILLLILSGFMYKFKLQSGYVNVCVFVIYIVANLIGGLVIGKVMKEKKFIWGAISGAIYFAILLAISLLVNKGITNDVFGTLWIALSCVGGGTLGGMVS